MDYEINKDTLVILPTEDYNSKVIEKDNEYVISNSTFEVIEHSCKYFGSSYSGRFEGTKLLLGFNYKVPIIIEESHKIIFFPTTSPKKEECIWVSLNNIDSYRKSSIDGKSVIKFKTGDELELDVSYNSLENQIFRATRLQLVIEERINKITNKL